MILVYGRDSIKIEGDINKEVYVGEDEETILCFDDGTILKVRYSPDYCPFVWKILVLSKGTEFFEIETCDDAESDDCTDRVTLHTASVLVVSPSFDVYKQRDK